MRPHHVAGRPSPDQLDDEALTAAATAGWTALSKHTAPQFTEVTRFLSGWITPCRCRGSSNAEPQEHLRP